MEVAMPYELLYRSPNEFDDGSEVHDIQMPKHSETFEAASDEEAIAHAKETLKDGKLTYRGDTYHREAVSLKFKQERTILLN